MSQNPVAYSSEGEKVQILEDRIPESQIEKLIEEENLLDEEIQITSLPNNCPSSTTTTAVVVVIEESPPPSATTRSSCNIRQCFFKPCCGEWTWNLKWQFPYFLVLMAVIQYGMFYTISSKETLSLLFGYDPQRRHEFWRLFSVMLAHSGKPHVIGNVTFQLIYGVHLELVHHWRRIAVIYVASVLGGSLLISVIAQRKYAVGSSGANFGLLFANLSHIIVNWNEIDRKLCRLVCLLVYISYKATSTMEMFDPESTSSTSHAGHVGGAITGFFLSFVVLKHFGKGPVSGWEKKWQKICIGILVLGLIIVLVINVGFPSHYADTEWNFSYNASKHTYIRNELTKEMNKRHPELMKDCLKDPECRRVLDKHGYNYNLTMPSKN